MVPRASGHLHIARAQRDAPGGASSALSSGETGAGGVTSARTARSGNPSSQGTSVVGGIAFNIKAEYLRLGDFTPEEVRALLGQHTGETGQKFGPGAMERIWELTLGQPWLVNALAYQACFKDRVGRDRGRSIGAGDIDTARGTLVRNRVTLLDQLANQLREERVRRVILLMLDGSLSGGYSLRDLWYVRDLGLVAPSGAVRMANPIYADVIPQELTAVQESELESLVSTNWHVRDDGSLDLPKLLGAFQATFGRTPNHGWSATDTGSRGRSLCCTPTCTA